MNLNDGKNIIVEKDIYKTGDSLLLKVPELKIEKHLKRDKNSLCFIIKGKKKGKVGKIKDIKKFKSFNPNLASIEIDQKTVDVPEKFVFVVGEKTMVLKV